MLLRIALALSIALLALQTLSCERPTLLPPTETQATVAGRVWNGPTSNARVSVFRLVNGERGVEVGTTQSAEDGTFRVSVGLATTGPFIVVASGGTGVDLATGAAVNLGRTDELTAIVPTFAASTSVTLLVSPISHLTAALTLHEVRSRGTEIPSAYYAAAQHLHGHFGGIDWSRVSPADLTATAATTLDDTTKAGLLVAGLSMQARTISEAAGLTPGSIVSGFTLTQALHEDLLADGLLDGRGAAGALTLPTGMAVPPAYRLDGNTARVHLAQALARFLTSERNAALALRPSDVQPLAAAVATNANPAIFTGEGSAVDITPPEVTWVTPPPGSGVSGAVALTVRAVDGTGLRQFRITAPAPLAGLQGVIDGTTATIVGTLDVSSFPDGPLELVALAEDLAGNVVTPRCALTVANRGPSVAVSSPADGTTVSGIVTLSATATPQQGNIRRLSLKDAPAGVSADALPAADSYSATWDTRLAQEGETILVFRAEDSVGGVTDLPVRVTVDNVPFGTVRAYVSAGSPIAGATVQLIAIDATTGAPANRPGGAVLGVGGPTEANGFASFTLTGENWDGPVRLEASGAGLSYVDPSDGVTAVSIPANILLTSLHPRYKTGDALTAPVTLYTTLADSAALAFARGSNPTHPPSTLPAALATSDRLFEQHIAAATPWALRTIVPASLTTPPQQTLRDVVFAALPDVALNALARRVALSTGLTPVSGFDALKLVGLLQRDVSDGRFDGREGSVPLRVLGSPAYPLTADELRVRLALGLDDFIIGPHNTSGLTRADLRVAEPNVYDTISLDDSALFDPSVAPTPFDTTPPTVAVAVSFTGDDGVLRSAPVGPELLVANTLNVVVTAQDPENSGIRLLAVTVGGKQLVNQDTSPGRLAGAFTPTEEGPLELVAISEDALGNRATVRKVLQVDNTPPVLNVTAPAANGFYGLGPVALAATADDAGGIASHSVTGLPGGASTTGLASLTGSWTPPTGSLDGPVSATWSACDNAGNCRTAAIPFTLDRTPPAIAWAPAPPKYVNTSNVTLTLAATDIGAGVGAVFARRATSPGEALPATRRPDGTWAVTVPLAASDAPTTILVWGSDLATPSNQGADYPSSDALRTHTVTRDTVAPAIALVAGGSYKSESTIFHQESSPGIPVVPVVYTGLAGSVTPLASNSTINKATTRIAPGVLTYDELTTSNITNTPWLAYQSPQAATEAPITAARYAITCAGCLQEESSGEVTLSSDSTNGFQRFALPLTAETIPGLLTAPVAAVTLTITLTVTDQAGNSSTTAPAFLTFNLIAPGISLSRETAYPESHDPKSAFGYKISIGTYDELWSATTPAFEGTSVMRIARFVVRNPHPVPVAVNLSPAGPATWTLSEKWQHTVVADPNTGAASRDGFSYARTITYDLTGSYSLCSGTPRPPSFPCAVDGDMGTALEASVHEFGTTTQWQCLPPALPTGTTTSNSASWDSVGYRSPFTNPWPHGGEPESERAPAKFPLNGRSAWLIPAATATTPGQLIIYAVIPRSRGTMPAFTGSDVYEYLYAYAYGDDTGAGSCRQDGVTSSLTRVTRKLVYRTMTSASLTASWFWQLAGASVRPDGSQHGGPRSTLFGSIDASVDFTRN